MPVASAATRRVVLAHSDQILAVRARVLAFADHQWRSLGSWRDADAAAFTDRVVPVILAGQRQTASLTDSYLATLARATVGSGRVVGVPSEVATGARGIAPEIVYQRPFNTVRFLLSEGRSLVDAVEQGRQRLGKIGATDLQLARTHAARFVMQGDERVVGFRRVVSGGDPCALCEIAATQRYHSEDLLPIHPGCSCDVEPIYGTKDPGSIIDADGLAGVKDSLAERGLSTSSAPSDLRQEVKVREHGEIGPVLTQADHNFRGPDNL